MVDYHSTPFIRIRGLHKKLGWQHILRGIDLDVFRGETLCIIGPSGEGKTVTMKHVIGLMQPDEGTVEVDGIQVNGLRERELAPVRQRVSMLFQNGALFDSLTVAQNVDKLPVNLSGGMRKRAGIARAVVTRAQCILYDEPTSSLDPVVSDVIDTLILRLQERHGITSLVVTHDMKSLFKIANRIAMLKDGVIRFLGTREELRAFDDEVVQDFIAGRAHVDF
jgi:phospholipid/cholesterol/gamma-HCH transport system ATP-binding protein